MCEKMKADILVINSSVTCNFSGLAVKQFVHDNKQYRRPISRIVVIPGVEEAKAYRVLTHISGDTLYINDNHCGPIEVRYGDEFMSYENGVKLLHGLMRVNSYTYTYSETNSYLGEFRYQ